MAKSEIRITPRVSHSIRAIEAEVSRQWNDGNRPGDAATHIVFDYGDLKFKDLDCGCHTKVEVVDAAMARLVVPDDREFFLDHHHYCGTITLRKYKSKEKKREVFYSAVEINLVRTPC